MITFLEMEHGLPAGKVLAMRYKTTSHVVHAPPFSIPLGSGILARCLGNVDGDSNLPSRHYLGVIAFWELPSVGEI